MAPTWATVFRIMLALLLQNAETYAFFELRRGSTEVLNKGGTNVFLMNFHIGATLTEYLGSAP